MQAEVQRLKQTNTLLSQQLAVHEVEGPPVPHPRSPLKQVPLPSQTAPVKGSSGPVEPSSKKFHGQNTELQAEGKVFPEEQLQNQASKASFLLCGSRMYGSKLYTSTWIYGYIQA